MTAPPAIEFPPGVTWLNVARPLTATDLRGRAVLLDFWTYGCVNCLQLLPLLRRLEAKYGDRLAIVGVHSPKFDHEKHAGALARFAARHEIRHPIVHDAGFALWEAYEVRVWPTLILLDRDGRVRERIEGDGPAARVDAAIEALLRADPGGPAPAPLPLAPHEEPDLLLRAPGKLAANERFVAIADTGHHCVRIATHAGRLLQTIGGNGRGFADGSHTDARFDAPQGLAFAGDVLFVADAGNHALRSVHLGDGEVATIAAREPVAALARRGPFPLREAGLASPWALAWRGGRLHVANAGTHRILVLDFAHARLEAWAGSGEEDLVDGTLDDATFAQPSGLAMTGELVYVVDAEASALRRIDPRAGRVATLAGTGLFEFGDQDGDLQAARFQHPLDIVALDPERLVVADTYNHKLRFVHLAARHVSTLVGTGAAGDSRGYGRESQLDEPGGLAVLPDGSLLVADTNNHRIARYDFATERIEDWPLHP